MSDQERCHHTCEYDCCMNKGGGVPAQATRVVADHSLKGRRLSKTITERKREQNAQAYLKRKLRAGAPRGTASAEAKREWKRAKRLRRQLGNGTGQP